MATPIFKDEYEFAILVRDTLETEESISFSIQEATHSFPFKGILKDILGNLYKIEGDSDMGLVTVSLMKAGFIYEVDTKTNTISFKK